MVSDHPPVVFCVICLRPGAHSSSNSGTTNDIVLKYKNRTGTYSCTITETISDGETVSCVPTLTGTGKSSDGYDWLYAEYASSSSCSDGLRVTEVAVKNSTTWYTLGTFDQGIYNTKCEGCSWITLWEGDCNSCWLDCDGNGNCSGMKWRMTTAYNVDVYCTD